MARHGTRLVMSPLLVLLLLVSGFAGSGWFTDPAAARSATVPGLTTGPIDLHPEAPTTRPLPAALPTSIPFPNPLTLSVNGMTGSTVNLHADDTITATASTRFIGAKRVRICTEVTCGFIIAQSQLVTATSVTVTVGAGYALSLSITRSLYAVVDTGNGTARATLSISVFTVRDISINDGSNYDLPAGNPLILRSTTPGQFQPGYFEAYSDTTCGGFVRSLTAYRAADGRAEYATTFPVDDTTSYRFFAASNGRYSSSTCLAIVRVPPYPGIPLTVNGVAGNILIPSGTTVVANVNVSPSWASNVIFHSYNGANCSVFVGSVAGTRTATGYELRTPAVRTTRSYIATATTPGGTRLESACRSVRVSPTPGLAVQSGSPSAAPSAPGAIPTAPVIRPPRPTAPTATPVVTSTPSSQPTATTPPTVPPTTTRPPRPPLTTEPIPTTPPPAGPTRPPR